MWVTVHPRVRGEHNVRVPVDQSIVRFIPACAGNTNLGILWLTYLPVHPRVRGEHNPDSPLAHFAGGSSPRARGTPKQLAGSKLGDRFIPACAGNTITCRGTHSMTTVHPRVRGEHAESKLFSESLAGSSPRARGTRKSVQ